jgi:hypothetical protein
MFCQGTNCAHKVQDSANPGWWMALEDPDCRSGIKNESGKFASTWLSGLPIRTNELYPGILVSCLRAAWSFCPLENRFSVQSNVSESFLIPWFSERASRDQNIRHSFDFSVLVRPRQGRGLYWNEMRTFKSGRRGSEWFLPANH